MESYKEREIQFGQMVDVYYNLHNHLFSVRDAATGYVLGHTETVNIRNPKFIVNEAGRLRVLREQRKNVHAYIRGIFEGTRELDSSTKRQYYRLYYNPYKVSHFMVEETSLKANDMGYTFAHLSDKKIYAR